MHNEEMNINFNRKQLKASVHPIFNGSRLIGLWKVPLQLLTYVSNTMLLMDKKVKNGIPILNFRRNKYLIATRFCNIIYDTII